MLPSILTSLVAMVKLDAQLRLSSGYISRKPGFGPSQKRALIPVHSRTATHGASVLVRKARGPAGPREAFVPIHVDPFFPVLGTYRDQWSSLLAHNH